HDSYAVRVGDCDGSLEISAFLNPGCSRHLAVAIQCEPRRENRIGVSLAARVNDSDTGADWSPSNDQLATSGDKSCVADFDTGDVSDRVEHTRRSAYGKLEIVLSRLCLTGQAHRADEQCDKRHRSEKPCTNEHDHDSLCLMSSSVFGS